MLDIHPLPVPRPELAVALRDVALRWGQAIVVPRLDPEALRRIDDVAGLVCPSRAPALRLAGADRIAGRISPVLPAARRRLVIPPLLAPGDLERALQAGVFLAGREILVELDGAAFATADAQGWARLRARVGTIVSADLGGPGWWRRDREVELQEDLVPAAVEDVTGEIDRAALVEAILRRAADLSTLELEALVGHVAGQGTAETAGRLGVAEATVRVALHRARAKLRKDSRDFCKRPARAIC